MHKPGYRLALFATFLAVVVVLLGAYTRLTHAGLGCPDWPGCYGFLGVPMSEHKQALAEARFPEAPMEVEQGWNEMVPRYFAGTLGLVILLVAISSLPSRGTPGQPPEPPLLLVVVGFATLALLFLLCLRLSRAYPALPSVPSGLRALAGCALLLVIGQISLGGWVSSNYAAVACVDLPTCHGEWWPAMDFANGFHLTQ